MTTMNEFENRTKTESEMHLRETPELFAPELGPQNDLVPLADRNFSANQAAKTVDRRRPYRA
jgi:hypothetical protein